MLSMEEFGSYDEAPVALAKIVRHVYIAHNLNELHNFDESESVKYLCKNSWHLVTKGCFDAVGKFRKDVNAASDLLVMLVQAYDFDDVKDKTMDQLLAELTRLDQELNLCYVSARDRYGAGLEDLVAGISELTRTVIRKELTRAAGYV